MADRLTETVPVYQLPAHVPPSQRMELTGANESDVTVKLAGLDVIPALFVAVTSFGSVGSVALVLNV